MGRGKKQTPPTTASTNGPTPSTRQHLHVPLDRHTASVDRPAAQTTCPGSDLVAPGSHPFRCCTEVPSVGEPGPLSKVDMSGSTLDSYPFRCCTEVPSVGESSSVTTPHSLHVGQLVGSSEALVDTDTILDGDYVHSGCDTRSLLPLYVATRDAAADDNPEEDLDALHPRHFEAYSRQNPRRSARFLGKRPRSPSPPPKVVRKPKKSRSNIGAAPADKWMSEDGELLIAKADWTTHVSDLPVIRPDRAESFSRTPSTASTSYTDRSLDADHSQPNDGRKKHHRSSQNARKKRRGGTKNKKQRNGEPNPQRNDALVARTFAAGDAIQGTFSILEDATHSASGWQGGRPPEPARYRINELHQQLPDAKALHPWLKYFAPIAYIMGDGIRERGTFFLDCNRQIFMYRSHRALWIRDRIDELEVAHNTLVGNDLESTELRAEFQNAMRGPHLALILGHHRQSATKPFLTAWHREHPDRVQKFLGLPIMQQIIRFVSSVIRIVFPGVAARFEADAEWHRERYQIRPLFGLFWNFCLNACFRGQPRVQSFPHADSKNQVSVCALLIYVLKSGWNFNHTQRTWIVLWEGNVAVELPPWVLAAYPSAIFYHFNVDIHDIEFVYTNGEARPTRENSRPIVAGDEHGRGSMVFFNQSTMRHGPITGFDTLEKAVEAGHSGTTDYGTDIQAAFQKALILTPIPEELRNSSGVPSPSDFQAFM
ncbi:hypothetical protein C8R44DRAFT_877464 [Mycena epipterygia]|nr:hypothetical protein C8R44DRAFT_877464 [Mycena epipterygia]